MHVMLGYLLQQVSNYEKFLDTHEFYYEPKIDGIRAITFPDGSVYSRYGNRLNVNFSDLKIPKGFVLDGEIISKEGFYKSGVIKAKHKQVNLKGIRYYIFDIIPEETVKKGKTYEKSIEERKLMLNDIKKLNKSISYVTFLTELKKYKDGKNFKKLLKQFENYEGYVLKQVKSIYIPRRTKLWIKVKHLIDIDVVVVGFEISKKLPNAIAAIIVKYKNHEFKVGTGFTEKQRQVLYQLQNELIGSVINISALEITPYGAARHNSFNYFNCSIPKKLKKILCQYQLVKPDCCFEKKEF